MSRHHKDSNKRLDLSSCSIEPNGNILILENLSIDISLKNLRNFFNFKNLKEPENLLFFKSEGQSDTKAVYLIFGNPEEAKAAALLIGSLT